MIMNACQGAFLGQQNTVTPLAIFVAAAVCNTAMGVTFVLGFGWGLQGAALATACVQVRRPTAHDCFKRCACTLVRFVPVMQGEVGVLDVCMRRY